MCSEDQKMPRQKAESDLKTDQQSNVLFCQSAEDRSPAGSRCWIISVQSLDDYKAMQIQVQILGSQA